METSKMLIMSSVWQQNQLVVRSHEECGPFRGVAVVGWGLQYGIITRPDYKGGVMSGER